MTLPLASTQLVRTQNYYVGTLDYPVRGTFSVTIELLGGDQARLRITQGTLLHLDTVLEKRYDPIDGTLDEVLADRGFYHGHGVVDGYEHEVRFGRDGVLALFDIPQRVPGAWDVSWVNPPVDYSKLRGGKRG